MPNIDPVMWLLVVTFMKICSGKKNKQSKEECKMFSLRSKGTPENDVARASVKEDKTFKEKSRC